jgi:hypothetical protein
MMKGDSRARWPIYLDPKPPNKILTKIQDCLARWRFQDFLGALFLDFPNIRLIRSSELSLKRRQDAGPMPPLILITKGSG